MCEATPGQRVKLCEGCACPGPKMDELDGSRARLQGASVTSHMLFFPFILFFVFEKIY